MEVEGEKGRVGGGNDEVYGMEEVVNEKVIEYGKK